MATAPVQRPPPAPRLGDLAGAAALLLEDARIAVALTDSAGRVVYRNRPARSLGEAVAADDVRGWPGRWRLETGPCPPERFPPVAVLEGRGGGELELCLPDGRWLAVEAQALRDESGGTLGAIVLLRDVTVRKQVERALAEERRQLSVQHRRQSALATIQQAISEPRELAGALRQIVDLATEHLPSAAASIVLWNRETETFEISVSTFAPEDDETAARRVRRKGGTTRWIVDHGRPLVVPDVREDPFGANPMLEERAMRAYAGVPLVDDGAVIGVLYVLDVDTRHYTDDDIDFLTSLASRATTALGKVELYQQLRAVNEQLNERSSELAEHQAALERLVEKRTRELRRSLDRLRAADRLATVGTLTAGLGHDINNILFPIRCRLEALDRDDVPASFKDTIDAVTHATEYLQQLSDGLRLFARDPERAEPASETTDIDAWWAQVRPLLVKTLPAHVAFEEDLPPDLPLLRVAPHRLTQALLNLVVNAGEAIEDVGTIRVTAAADGDRVRISVADDGHGMTPDVQNRIFDPFFTTKTRGLSTGLGLSLVHGVIRSSAGASLDVHSVPGTGAEFVMAFPVADEGDRPARLPAAVGVAAVRLEDPRTAAWTEQYLVEAGYEIAEGEDAATADLLVADTAHGVRAFLDGGERRVILCGPDGPDDPGPGLTRVASAGDLPAIRDAIRVAAGGERP